MPGNVILGNDDVVLDELCSGVIIHRHQLRCGNRRFEWFRRPWGCWRNYPTRRRQRDDCCRTRRGRRRPVGYDVLPGQLANRWAVEIGQGLGGFRQARLEIEAKVSGFEHRFGGGSGRRLGCLFDSLALRARRDRTGLARQFVLRHLACIGRSGQRLKAKCRRNRAQSSPADSAARRCSSPTIEASARVVVSPRLRPSATSRNRRRMILPLRVLGRSAVK